MEVRLIGTSRLNTGQETERAWMVPLELGHGGGGELMLSRDSLVETSFCLVTVCHGEVHGDIR